MTLTSKSTSVAGKGCGTMFFGVFAAMGMLFLVLMGREVLKELRTRSWEATPCNIESIAVIEKRGNDSPFTIAVRYHYSVRGRSYTSEQFAIKERTFRRGSEAAQVADGFPAGASATCYVNPDAPQEAVLEREWPPIILMLLLPLVFIAIGVIGIIATWRTKPAGRAAISARRGSSPNRDRWIGVIFGGVFFVIGAAVGGAMFVRPLVKGLAARGWARVPCVITHSDIRTSRGDEGGSQYELDIRYRYKAARREYLGDRYDFNTSTSSLRAWRTAVVRQYPVGKKTECLVNPADPRDAVLSTELGGDRWFMVFPIGFMVMGAGIAIAIYRSKPKGSAVPTATVANAGGSVFTSAASGPVELRPAGTPMGKFLGLTFIALFWNGMTWGFFLVADTIGRIFLSIFIGGGAFLLWSAITQFLVLFNPRPTLRVSTGAVRLGESARLDWRFSGSVRRIAKLTLTLQAVERATYRRGTDTTTDTNRFVHQQLFETSDAAAIASGEVSVAIPADSIHSLDAPNNKIVWTLHLHGDIARWPDVDFEFPITVLPHATTP